MAKDSDVLIIGGGLSGLSTGCYARMNGWSTHILEHNLELGGVCTAWRRDDYLIDGCIHWLMGAGEGGMFDKIYRELGVIPQVPLETIDLFHRYEDAAEERVVELTRDAAQFREDLRRLSPDDGDAINHLFDAVDRARELPWPVDRPPELDSVGDRLRALWDARGLAGTLLHFRGSVGEWCERNVHGPTLRRYLTTTMAADMPMIFLPFMLRHHFDGLMSRPVGGSGVFRDAIERRYRELGGEVTLHTTVEEILVEDDRAIGVRLTDGTQLRADHIVSTASAHETLLRLLGGRYLDRATRHRLEGWPLFDPIVLFSAGVALPLDDVADTLIVRQLEPLRIGDIEHDSLYLRIYNAPAFAPKGHAVVQTMLNTDYDWWAAQGSDYHAAKMRVQDTILDHMDRRLPGVRDAVRMADVATPLTFWRHTRSWRGAYEGWMATPETFRTHVPKSAPGLEGLHFAGQWVEPGGGVPTALVSGRQLVQILCEGSGREFHAEVPA